jgi:eukaryotic-like serine/threonine-protein kinase
LNIGETIGDYRIVDLLGVGGMGSVYRVQNTITDRMEAMKVLLPDLRSAPDLAERFGREIKIHASLDHPNIASLRTAIRVENQLLMIMELVEGVTLEKRLRQSPIHLWRSVDWVVQVLSALSYAHGRGIIHRDIKPGNIMITPANVVKLTDFGVASISADRRLTRTGMAVGSLHYMSPEQVQAGQLDARSDIYSLGVTFYEMLSGRRPFEGKSEYEVMRAHLEQEPVPLYAPNGTVPYSIAAAVSRAMAKQPQDRFQTALEFKAMLEVAKSSRNEAVEQPTEEMELPLPSSTPPRATPPRPSEGFGRSSPPVGTLGTGTLDPSKIDRVRKELAQYVGPLAGVLVDRAAKRALDMRQLYDILATEISGTKEREAFLLRRPK